jgi:hypothetical protein
MTEQQQHRARIVRKAIESIEAKLGTPPMKPTLVDLVRLLQLEKELGEDEPREVRVRWVETERSETLETMESSSKD